MWWVLEDVLGVTTAEAVLLLGAAKGSQQKKA